MTLWINAARHQREAMAWHDNGLGKTPHGKPVSVRHAGFAGYVSPHDPDDFDDGSDSHDEFDEDLYDSTAPEPTHDEQKHLDEHGEHPESYYERHDQAYGEAHRKKQAESEPDEINEDLGTFVREHAHSGERWRQHGTFGHVDLTQPIHATQSHVHTGHMDRHDAGGGSWHLENGGYDNDYPADEHPLFATHQGKTHVIDGHNRVAAAFRQGDKSIEGWHMNLDQHKHLTEPDEDY